MRFKLKEELKKLCQESEPKLDLDRRLDEIKEDAIKIWEPGQRLYWFTDHSAESHSEFIISHLSELLEPLQKTKAALNAPELFVLLASCYLHDIGMQFYKSPDGRGVEDFNNDDDFNRIRKEHPKIGEELILKRSISRERDQFQLRIEDQYIRPIAYVSKGHGTDYFDEAIDDLEKLRVKPNNERFRGNLLTALLLMGDELDLHERRSNLQKELSYSARSILHHRIHSYINGVDIVQGGTSKERVIRLNMSLPSDAKEKNYEQNVKDWVVSKLKKQINRTNSIIIKETDGELKFSDSIDVNDNLDKTGVIRSFYENEKSIKSLQILQKELDLEKKK